MQRLKWLRVSWLLASVLAGCMSPVLAEKDDGGDVVLPDPLQKDDAPPSSIAVSASPDAFAAIHEWLGDANTITVGKAMTIDRPEVTLNIPAGANVTYEINSNAGLFTFANPLPKINARVLGFKVSPTLSRVTLNQDGSGIAATGLGRYRFKWIGEEDTNTAAKDDELPEVWAYSMAGCVPCVRAKLEIANAKELPFRVVWKDEAAPNWLQSRPAFWWHTSEPKPSQDDVANTRQLQGWNGLRDLTERWKATRSPKRFQRSTTSLIGVRTVAKWSINGDFTPSRSTLISHLSSDGIHRGRHDRATLETLTTEQLRWLHDRDHGG